ncbi:MAG: sensor histidine kinase, partial [Cyanobacteria bacterium P01_D01_bin.115]
MPDVRAIRPDNHPFPFLLYGEWALLGMALFSELTPRLLPRAANLPATALVAILAFGALGLWLPTRPLGLKL